MISLSSDRIFVDVFQCGKIIDYIDNFTCKCITDNTFTSKVPCNTDMEEMQQAVEGN